MNPNNYKFNLQKSLVDPRDFMLESIYPETVTLPKNWDLRKEMQPIRDQGTQGTCSGQAVSAMKEWQEYSDVALNEYMSPQFIYNLRENQGNEGMSARDTMKILFTIGIVSEKDYPYNNFKSISNDLKLKAEKYKIQGYAQVNTIDSTKKALFANGPCYIAFPVYNAEKKNFWIPDYKGQQALGGHAVCIVGYLENEFIIRNSWSTQWGDNGYTYYSFTDFGCHWEIWTAIDADSNPQGLNDKINKYHKNGKWFMIWKNKFR